VPHAVEPSLHPAPAAAALTRSLRPAFDNPSQANFGDPNRLAAHLAQATLSATGAIPAPSASALPHGPNSTLLLRQQLKELQNDVRTVAASKIAERERTVIGASAAAAVPTYRPQDSVYSGLVPVELPHARVQKKRVVPPQITPEYSSFHYTTSTMCFVLNFFQVSRVSAQRSQPHVAFTARICARKSRFAPVL
jgi:hypothetical protein